MSNELGSDGYAGFEVHAPSWAKAVAGVLVAVLLVSALETSGGYAANIGAIFVQRLGELIKHAHAAGYLASVLVFATFWMKDIVSLRMTAITSNIAFFIYGADLGLTPVWVLHASLLPLNIWRLSQALQARSGN